MSLSTGSGGETSDYAPLVPFKEIFHNSDLPPPPLPPRKPNSNSEDQSLTEEDVYAEIDSNAVRDSSAGKSKLSTPKTEKRIFKFLTKKKQTDNAEKDFKHLENSIKARIKQVKHVADKKTSSEFIDTKDVNTGKVHTEIRKPVKATPGFTVSTKIESEPRADVTDLNDERYVRLTESDQQGGYLQVDHQTDEIAARPDSNPYAIIGPDDVNPNPLSSNRDDNVITREDVTKMTISELGKHLQRLKLEKYVEPFKAVMVDGALIQELSIGDLMTEFNFTRLEALRLVKFAKSGHIPKWALMQGCGNVTSRKHAYIILTPLNPTFI